jgi:hypothetical protein
MSKTSTSIGWVLVDERDTAGAPLDHDWFDITDSSAAAPAATARRVREIATASGYTVDSVHVTTSGNASSLRDAFTESGFDDIVCVSLTAATRAWAVDTARGCGHETLAVCLLGRDSASLSLIDTSSETIRATTTTTSPDSAGLTDWLRASLGGADSRLETVYLIGSRAKLKAVAGPLADDLSIPVVATHDAQLALARGAALSDATDVDQIVTARRSGFAAHARTAAVIAAVAVVSLFALSSAGNPIPLAEKHFREFTPPSAAGLDHPPGNALPVTPVALPPPPATVPRPMPEEPSPASKLEATPVRADVVAPQTIPAAVPRAVDQPVQHLPDVQPVQHMPGTQAAPGPDAPAALPPPPPPPPDPLAGVLSPMFGGLP